jgi:hypothetical protein
MTTNPIPINSVAIPPELVEFCCEWYDGQASMMYAIASTGGLTLGTIRPRWARTEAEWYCGLFDNLAAELRIHRNPETGRTSLRRTGEVKSVDGSKNLNLALWQLATRMAELKQS